MTAKIEFCNDVSVMGRKWEVKQGGEPSPFEDVDPTVVSIADARGFDPERFFRPSIKTEMPDPSVMKGMDEAVAKFCDAVETGKKIAVYGDYDVDGATSTSLMMRWLSAMGRPSPFYIPDRIKEGYGPNSAAIRRLREEHGTEFILFLDCGTRAHEPLGVAEELGMEIVILDHHLQDDRDPPGVLVNPNRRDETKEFGYLCTAGLAFLFLVAVQREMRSRGFFDETRLEVQLMDWIGLAALGTVCDLVPLKGLNRAIVARGMPKMGEITGLKALRYINGDPDLNEHTCGFVFGPCINAEGRIGDTRSGTMLLSTDDLDEAHEIAIKLFETNKERQEMTKAAQAAAVQIASTEMVDDSTIVIYNEDWHPGIVGIVASKVKDAVNKPTIIIGSGGTGSCRSVTGYNIGADVDAALAAEVISKGGGHMMAAGLHVNPKNVDKLRKLLCSRSAGYEHPPLEIDLAIGCGGMSASLLESMERLRPFGMGNPQPRIALHGGMVTRVEVMKGLHIKLHMAGRFGTAQALLFNAIGTPLGDALKLAEDKFVDVYGKARVDFFAGKKRPVLLIEDAMIKDDAVEAAA